ncbi:MAG: hypothetical protein WC378_09265 [Opitutaceae bacterium]|jgi:outer membrane protein assembly factor BamD (BamD/ComL family)
MKTSVSIPIGLLGLIILLLAACSNPEKDLAAAKDRNTEDAYHEFIRKHIKHPLVAEANQRLVLLAYNQAKADGSAGSFKKFLQKYPDSTLTQQANSDLEMAEFVEASKSATRAAWVEYLSRNDSSPHSAEARSQIDELDYKAAQQKTSIAGWNEFLVQHPNSVRHTDALAQLAMLNYSRANLDNSVTAWEEFLRYHPDAQQSDEARMRLSVLLFAQVKAPPKTDAKNLLWNDSYINESHKRNAQRTDVAQVCAANRIDPNKVVNGETALSLCYPLFFDITRLENRPDIKTLATLVNAALLSMNNRPTFEQIDASIRSKLYSVFGKPGDRNGRICDFAVRIVQIFPTVGTAASVRVRADTFFYDNSGSWIIFSKCSGPEAHYYTSEYAGLEGTQGNVESSDKLEFMLQRDEKGNAWITELVLDGKILQKM